MLKFLKKSGLPDWRSAEVPWDIIGPEMADHLRSVIAGKPKLSSFKCNDCGHFFDTKHGLSIHQGKRHRAVVAL